MQRFTLQHTVCSSIKYAGSSTGFLAGFATRFSTGSITDVSTRISYPDQARYMCRNTVFVPSSTISYSIPLSINCSEERRPCKWRMFLVQHRPGKLHVIPDALSRLDLGTVGAMESSVLSKTAADESEAYHATLVKMSYDFKSRLRQAYAANDRWARILAPVQPTNGENPRADSPQEELRFKVRNRLV